MYTSIYKEALFKDKVIIVTGGGSGIGRCTAHELASLGAHLILIGRSLDKLQNVAAELENNGYVCDFYSVDIRDSNAIKTALNGILSKHGKIHLNWKISAIKVGKR